MSELRLLGRSADSERLLYVASVPNLNELPDTGTLREPGGADEWGGPLTITVVFVP
jgi:hypothetical protein